ncbi:MAG: TIGR00341 family protein [Arenicella sp.]|nr:TIGR00341 family protein [Arenicella sp.]
MSGKIIEVTCKSGHLDTLLSIGSAEYLTVLGSSQMDAVSGRVSVRLFVEDKSVQKTIDQIRSTLPSEADSLILVLPVDAQIGGNARSTEEADIDEAIATREELFANISRGTKADFNFFLLTVLATIVTSIGIAEDNVAVVISAMVIAPLLGPNLGLALGTALGDRKLITTALFTNAAGLTVTVLFAALIALIWPPNLNSNELLTRTIVQPGSIVLALAAGVAAVQSLVTRLASLLVGVMVAVALIPPATVLGMLISVQQWDMAAGAGLLLAINVACVNLSAQLVFILHGIRPRTWIARRVAQQSTWINLLAWAILLGICILMVSWFSSEIL